MAVDGAIAIRARSNLPTTWDALDAEDSGSMLTEIVADTKYELFNTVVDTSAEANTYTRLVLDYVGKMVALKVIPAGVDYWMNQPLSIDTSEVTESESYPDRVAALWKLQETLLAQTKLMEPDVLADVEIITRAQMGTPLVSDSGVPLITSDPHDFGRAFDLPTGA